LLLLCALRFLGGFGCCRCYYRCVFQHSPRQGTSTSSPLTLFFITRHGTRRIHTGRSRYYQPPPAAWWYRTHAARALALEFFSTRIDATRVAEFFLEMDLAQQTIPCGTVVFNTEVTIADGTSCTRFVVRLVAQGQLRIIVIDRLGTGTTFFRGHGVVVYSMLL